MKSKENSHQRQAELSNIGLFVADHIDAMLAYWDKDLVCVFANNSYREWFGKSREEMIGKVTLKELLGPLYEKNLVYIQGALAGKVQTFEREIKTPNGQIRHSLANYYPHVVNGEVQGFIVHVADISSNKNLEKKLLKSEELLNYAQQQAKMGSYEIDEESGSYIWSAYLYELFNLEKETNIQQLDWSKHIHPDDYASFMLIHEPSPKINLSTFSLEYKVKAMDGSYFIVHEAGSIVRDSVSGNRKIVGTIQNVNEQKQNELLKERNLQLQNEKALLDQSIQMRDHFLANVSHELRTPLHSILMNCELIPLQNKELNESAQKSLDKISYSGHFLQTLIEDMLDIARIDTGKVILQPERIAIHDLINDCIALTAGAAAKKQQQVICEIKLEKENIIADSKRLKQIFINLLNNAIKFTPSGGEVGIRVETNNNSDEAIFTIWDTGIGIAKEDLGNIFLPFYQTQSGYSKSEGIGIGLNIVNKLVQLHEGSIEVKSQLNKGSEFIVKLPLDFTRRIS